MKKNPLNIIVAVLLVIIFGTWLVCFQVRKSTVVVITTFGKPTRTLTEPGFYMKWPPPIQWVNTFDQRIQNFDDKLDEALTSDHYNLLTMVYVGWKIKNAQEFFPRFKNGSIAEAERTMEGLLRSAKSAVVGQHPLSDFVSTDEKQLKFDAVEQEILSVLQDDVNKKNYGIEIEFLGIKKLEFPESVTAGVFKLMTSDRQKLISKTQSEGEAEASRIRSTADSKSVIMLADANAEATRIKGEAIAEAAKSFVVFEQNPELARFLLSLNALELSTKQHTTLIFDQHSQPFNLFQDYTTNQSTGK
jgi:modulator of FtsH protease HflC